VVYQATNIEDKNGKRIKKCTRRRSIDEVFLGEKRSPKQKEVKLKKDRLFSASDIVTYGFEASASLADKNNCEYRMRHIYIDLKSKGKHFSTVNINGVDVDYKEEAQKVKCDLSRRSLICGESVLRLHLTEDGTGVIEVNVK
jgi:hypothetical protein